MTSNNDGGAICCALILIIGLLYTVYLGISWVCQRLSDYLNGLSSGSFALFIMGLFLWVCYELYRVIKPIN